MKKLKTRFMALALTGLMLTTTACGSDEQSKNGDTPVQEKEWAYVPEFLEIEGEYISYYDLKFDGKDKLYYTAYSFDETTGERTGRIDSYSMTDKSVSTAGSMPKIENSQEENGVYSGQSINVFQILKDGGFAAIINTYKSDPSGNYESWNSFAKYDAEGNEVFSLDMRELNGDDENNSYIRSIQVDEQGRFYLPSENKVFLIDAEGNSHGAAEAAGDSWINGAGVGKDGKVYICFYQSNADGGGYVLSEVDFDTKTVGEAKENFVGGNNEMIMPGLEKDFISFDSNSVYEYDMASMTSEKLFDWLDCDINGSFVRSIGVLEDKRIFAITQDWSTNENNVVLLTKTPYSEVPQKEEILIGTISGSYNITPEAVKFNRSSDKYHISVKQYLDYNNWTETSMSDAITALNNDLTSSNCPDIIDLTGLSVAQLASKGVFEDLTPYLEQSANLNREDYLESILNAFTYEGKLLAVPGSFELQTVIGSASGVGTEMGWTMADLIAYADANPKASIFNSMTQEAMMQVCMSYNESAFINWEDGTCSFDSQEFKDILEFVSRFPKEWEWSEEDASEPTKIQNGEVLLSNAYLYNFDEIQLYKEMFGGEITCIGFPTSDGSAGCALNVSVGLAITGSSDKKEAAWEFIESYLQNYDVEKNGFGFPSRKADLEKMAEEAVKVEYYLDENGNQILDESGEAVTMNSGSGVGYQDGWSYTYRIPTQEEVDVIMELVNVAKQVSTSNTEILKIINEDAAGFFSGQRTVDDVVKSIQSRVQIYVSENS